MKANRKLVLEDGSEFYGTGFGSDKEVVCEAVFNTSVTGYQEILSDPSYTDQAVVMTYPLIGNYGICDEDFESRRISPSALIIRDLNESPSNFRSTASLSELLSDNNVPGLYGVDTRRLVRCIRDRGSMKAMLTGEDTPKEEALKRLQSIELQKDAVRRVSCRKKWYSRTSNPAYSVAVIDCGMKSGIIRMLNEHRCNVTVVPFDAKAEEILSLRPEGVLISNGPGDPADVPETVETIRALRGKLPLFGICLGHQLIARAFGASTYKLKFGHRGGNHPVQETHTKKVCLTSQNHSYAVEESSLKGTGLEVSYVNLLDHTVEGLRSVREAVFSVQFHPESAPGPGDAAELFTEFTKMMEKGKS